jgi:glycosyltransferase involved in cell wall biosynthesis
VRVAWVTCHRPDPAGGGGAVAEFELIRAGAASHEIAVVSAGFRAGEGSAALTALGVGCFGVDWSPGPAPVGRVGVLRHVTARREPLALRQVQPSIDALRAEVARLHRQQPFDLVSVWTGEMAPVAGCGPPSALLLADCYSRQARRERDEATGWPQRLLWAVETRKTRRWERATYAPAAGIACLSALDGEALRALLGRGVDVLPLPVGAEWFDTPTEPRGDGVVFIGALNYRPNVEGLRWLASEIWPRVCDAVPGARLDVVGREPVPEVHDLVARCGGRLHADEPDVRPWYWRAGVAVAPVKLGSGTRNKVLHAFACGAPLVSTSASVEGLGCTPGRELLVADDPASFAEAVATTLLDPAAAGERASRAAAVARRHAGPAVAGEMLRFWERTVGCGSSS